MSNNYSQLSTAQIQTLEKNGCTSTDWSRIKVHENFNAKNVTNTYFTGEILIGSNSGLVEFRGGVKKQCGIYNASIHNCNIGNDVYINHITNYIANYQIEDNVVIENMELCVVTDECTFGNGIKIKVLDETGGRKVTMFDKLSAHLAYIMAFYKHRSCVIEELESKIQDYTQSVKSKSGTIGENTRIQNCKQIINVKFGSHCIANGVLRLEEGSVNSNSHAPVKLGAGVMANSFIISSGAEITDGCIISDCFIGQGCIFSKQYSAENSLFFANCQGFHGEACSVFGGPYTVTHHKSTLLIAGMFSFCNAGSGSNQSNHMYKLGPIHHGVAERGTKTTSDSYLLWPAKIGAFTMVMGRHYKNTDTSDLPFSYLIENKDDSWLAPGVNLQSVGTIRDVIKWPKRDRRFDPEKLDNINFNLLSPFTMQKMLNGLEILKGMKHISGETSEIYSFHNTLIRKSALDKGIELYNKAILKFLGNSVISKLKKCEVKSFDDIINCLKPTNDKGFGEWSDLAGLIAPQKEIRRILKNIEQKKYKDLSSIESDFRTLHKSYYDLEWIWASELLEKFIGKTIDKLTVDDLIELINKWKESVIGIDNLLYNDAKKEFRLDSMTGFGMDGNKTTKKLDFEKVRGNFENNDFVKEILDHIDRKTKLGNQVIEKLKLIKKINKEVQ